MNKHSLVHRLSLAVFASSMAVFGAQGSALAAWTPEFREHAPRYKETFPSAEFALMWGLARYDRPKLRTFKAAKVVKVANSGTHKPLRINNSAGRFGPPKSKIRWRAGVGPLLYDLANWLADTDEPQGECDYGFERAAFISLLVELCEK